MSTAAAEAAALAIGTVLGFGLPVAAAFLAHSRPGIARMLLALFIFTPAVGLVLYRLSQMSGGWWVSPGQLAFDSVVILALFAWGGGVWDGRSWALGAAATTGVLVAVGALLLVSIGWPLTNAALWLGAGIGLAYVAWTTRNAPARPLASLVEGPAGSGDEPTP